MPTNTLSTFWQTHLLRFSHNSLAHIVALFDQQGQLLYANKGMRSLLPPQLQPSLFLQNPTFEQLLQLPEQEQPVFEGLLTLSNTTDLHHTLQAIVFHHQQQLLLLAEFDIRELNYINQQLNELHSENIGLQRQLIREKRQLEQTLHTLGQTQTMLIHSEKMNAMGKLVAGIAHEINNPISFVQSNLHSLASTLRDIHSTYHQLLELTQASASNHLQTSAKNLHEEQEMDFLFEDLLDLQQDCLEGLSRVSQIVQDLRTFSRLDEAQYQHSDLLQNLHSTLSLAQPEIKKQKTNLRLELTKLPPIPCYPSELNQVFLNLIINAVQAMPPQGTLTIRTEEHPRNVTLSFSDNGPGIPPEHLDKIFDPFFTTKPPGAGTGLGLSLVYQIITEHHHGTVHVDSQTGQGATFTLTLPKETL